IEEKGDHIVRLQKSSVGIDDAEAICITVSSDADRGADLLHLLLGIGEEMVIRLGRMTAEEDIAVVVDGLDGYAGLAEQIGGIAAARAPEGIVDHFDTGFGDGLEID